MAGPTAAALRADLVKGHSLSVPPIHRKPFRSILGDAPAAVVVATFFARNAFHFANVALLNEWTLNHPEYTQHLREISVDVREGRFVLLTAALKRCKNLEKVAIGVDEASIIEEMAPSDSRFPRTGLRVTRNHLDGQLNFLVLRQYGIDALRALRFRSVTFTSFKQSSRPTPWVIPVTGPIPGGILETVIATEMMGPSPKLVKLGKRKTTECAWNDAKRLQTALVAKHFMYKRGEPSNGGSSSVKSSRLLDLPSELRNRIYEYVLCVDGKINPSKRIPTSHHRAGLNFKAKDKYREGPALPSVLALLQVNKQVHKEAVGIFYAQNEFTFYHPNQLIMFLAAISDTRKVYIQKVVLWYDNNNGGGCDSIDCALTALTRLQGLKALDIVYDLVLRHTKFPRAGEALMKELAEKGVDVQCKSLMAERFLFDSGGDEDNLFADEIKALMWHMEALKTRITGRSEETAATHRG